MKSKFEAVTSPGHVFSDGTCTIYPNPTNNCQIFSVSGIDSVIDEFIQYPDDWDFEDDDNDEVELTFDEERFKKYLKGFTVVSPKNQMLIDVSAHNVKYIEKVFGASDMTINEPYFNTSTGSDMVLMLIKTEKLYK